MQFMNKDKIWVNIIVKANPTIKLMSVASQFCCEHKYVSLIYVIVTHSLSTVIA